MLQLSRNEMLVAMALAGQTDVRKLDRSALV